MWRELSKALRELLQIPGSGAGSYRPDLHYMRGPGPKWHAKYGHLAPKASSAAKPPAPAIHDAVQHRA